MKKADLIERCKERECREQSRRFTSKSRLKVVKMASAIIEAICNEDGATPYIARNALKMAEEILTETADYEVIS